MDCHDYIHELEYDDRDRKSYAGCISLARRPIPIYYAPEPRRPLPQARNRAGRSVWEPPILDYSDLIGEEYEQKRKTLLKYFRDDVVKTTAYMDVKTHSHQIVHPKIQAQKQS